MADETEKTDQGDASKAPHTLGSGVTPPQLQEEAHILEEHIVAPTKSVPAPTPTPTKSTAPKSTIESLLESVKLPERKTEAPKANKVYDTSLAGDSTKPEHVAAQTEALETARTINEKLVPSEEKGDVRALHTLKDDLQHVVRDTKISLVRAVALEEEKRHHGTLEEQQQEIAAQKQKKSRSGLLFAVIFFVVGCLAIGSVLYVMGQRTQTIGTPITSRVLFAEQSVQLPLDNLAPADIRREIGNARTQAGSTLGAILQIVPTLRMQQDGQSFDEPVSFSMFLEKIGAQAPNDLMHALADEFFLGLHTVDENAPVIIIPVSSYERAFAGMLEWEKSMNRDLAPIVTPLSPQKQLEDGMIVERTFEDTVMRNYDVRALKDDSGAIQLYYSFPTRSILIIAESPYSFAEILSRLKADRKL